MLLIMTIFSNVIIMSIMMNIVDDNDNNNDYDDFPPIRHTVEETMLMAMATMITMTSMIMIMMVSYLSGILWKRGQKVALQHPL